MWQEECRPRGNLGGIFIMRFDVLLLNKENRPEREWKWLLLELPLTLKRILWMKKQLREVKQLAHCAQQAEVPSA